MVETMEGKWRTKDTTAWNEIDWRNAVLHHFEYNEAMGELYWRHPTSSRVSIGDPVGTRNPDGYIQAQLYGRLFKLHRIIWLIHHGMWPTHTIDHIDRDPSNNRIVNLRDVPMTVNGANGSYHADGMAQHKGVAYDPNYVAAPWRVQISRGGKVVHRSHHTEYIDACAKADTVYAMLDASSWRLKGGAMKK